MTAWKCHVKTTRPGVGWHTVSAEIYLHLSGNDGNVGTIWSEDLYLSRVYKSSEKVLICQQFCPIKTLIITYLNSNILFTSGILLQTESRRNGRLCHVCSRSPVPVARGGVTLRFRETENVYLSEAPSGLRRGGASGGGLADPTEHRVGARLGPGRHVAYGRVRRVVGGVDVLCAARTGLLLATCDTREVAG